MCTKKNKTSKEILEQLVSQVALAYQELNDSLGEERHRFKVAILGNVSLAQKRLEEASEFHSLGRESNDNFESRNRQNT